MQNCNEIQVQYILHNLKKQIVLCVVTIIL